MKNVADVFNVLPLSEAVIKLKNNTLPARSLCITFDDGYKENCTIALPILKKLSILSTFFISTKYINGDMMWNDSIIEIIRHARGKNINLRECGLDVYPIKTWHERRMMASQLLKNIKYCAHAERETIINSIKKITEVTINDKLMMTDKEIRILHNHGMEIGGHTVNHPILSVTPTSIAWKEIIDGKKMLEEIIGEPIRTFAYPNGIPGKDYSHEHINMLKQAGFFAAVSTSRGTANSATDVFQLPRFTPWDRNSIRFIGRLFENYRRKGEQV